MKRMVVGCFFMVVFAAQARLGEAVTDCDQRYNAGQKSHSSATDMIKPLATGGNSTNITYTHGGFSIRIGFRDGVATVVDYGKMGSQKMSPQEVDEILEANGGQWDEVPPYSARLTWKGMEEMVALGAGKGRVWMRPADHSAATLHNLGRNLRMKLNAYTLPSASERRRRKRRAIK